MIAGRRIGIVAALLDRQLVDAYGDRCGKVDDVQLAYDDAGRLEVEAVVSGPGALRLRVRRRTLRWLVGLAGDRAVAVSWSHVRDTRRHVELGVRAHTVGLSQGELHAGALLRRVVADSRWAPTGPRHWPVAEHVDDADAEQVGSDELRLTGLLGARAVTETGEQVGRVREVVVEKSGRMLGEAAGNAWVVVGVVLGGHGLRTRLRGSIEDEPTHPVVRLVPSAPAPLIIIGPALESDHDF